jgi:hypothetical protein
MRTRHQKLFEAQAIFEALAADAKLRDREEGMIPMAAETLARLGWQLLEDLPDWEEAEVKDQAKVVSVFPEKPAE